MAALIKLIDEAKVARVVARPECTELFAQAKNPKRTSLLRGMIQVQDAGALTAWVKQALEQEPKAAADVKAGKDSAIGRLVGVTMKLSGGKTDPNAVKAEILKQLG